MLDSLSRVLDCIQEVKQGGKKDQDTGNRRTRLSAPCSPQKVTMIETTRKASSLFLHHNTESIRSSDFGSCIVRSIRRADLSDNPHKS